MVIDLHRMKRKGDHGLDPKDVNPLARFDDGWETSFVPGYKANAASSFSRIDLDRTIDVNENWPQAPVSARSYNYPGYEANPKFDDDINWIQKISERGKRIRALNMVTSRSVAVVSYIMWSQI